LGSPFLEHILLEHSGQFKNDKLNQYYCTICEISEEYNNLNQWWAHMQLRHPEIIVFLRNSF